MSFAYPLGLLGLVSLPVILALHLLRERQRRYMVSHLELWSFLEQAVTGPRIRRLPLTTILLLDLALATLFSLAWAQPSLMLPLALPSARQRVIVVDVSSSMRAAEGLTSRLERAKTAALAIVEDSGPQDPLTLVTFGQKARLLVDNELAADAGLAEQITALQAGETGAAGSLQEALALGEFDPGPRAAGRVYGNQRWQLPLRAAGNAGQLCLSDRLALCRYGAR